MGAGLGVINGHGELVAVTTIPDRDPVPPPELAADAPVADVLQPVEVDLGEALRDDPYPLIDHGVDCRNSQGSDLNEPLLADPWFDHGIAAAAVPHGVVMGLHLNQKTFLLQVGENTLAAGEAVEPGIRPSIFIHCPIRV